jgi:hypothetical protein
MSMDSRESENVERLHRHWEILRLWEEDMSAYDELQKRYDHEFATREKLEAQLVHENECRLKLEKEVQLLRKQLEETIIHSRACVHRSMAPTRERLNHTSTPRTNRQPVPLFGVNSSKNEKLESPPWAAQ